METSFLCIIIFLFLLAVFDLSVGVSNDAVNFLNSALGAKAASFRRVVTVAAIGVFMGAAMSDGMMDIARHGIFRPEHFSFYDILCIFMAVMVTDILLLDMFNTLGMPTSTTVSMVFELLGAAFTVALIKMAGGLDLGLGDLLNTEKALSVVLGIFLSVAIAFFFGTLVQLVSRAVFSFDYRRGLKWKIGIFGGICCTAIIYFMLIKGAKDLMFMTPQVKDWISAHTWPVMGVCLAVSTLVMQSLHLAGVNVLKVIVLTGTFALAMAFAGNDLVNFIGVPLSGLSAWQDWAASGAAPRTHMMGALNGPADTPVWVLVGAGAVMVVSLATSRKARKVARTEIGLGSQTAGDETFGSSRLARSLVRHSLAVISLARRFTPPRVRRWWSRRFDTGMSVTEEGAAFDLIRACVNLVLAGALIALGTSLKLPLSTTFVTFMVAMGTSLADRAWSRESAVFRITGVISVIGGWFITAGAAFIGAGTVVAAMHLGGMWVMAALAMLVIFLIMRSNRRFRADKGAAGQDMMLSAILATDDKDECLMLLRRYVGERQHEFFSRTRATYLAVTEAFAADNARSLAKSENMLLRHKNVLKDTRRKETLCLRRLDRQTAIRKEAWFHLSNDCVMTVYYNMRRIAEMCREHVDNNFTPLPAGYRQELAHVCGKIDALLASVCDMLATGAAELTPSIRAACDRLEDGLTATCTRMQDRLRDGDPVSLRVMYVYLGTLQETLGLVSATRKYLKAWHMFSTS